MPEYRIRTEKTWRETITDLAECFRKWRVTQYQVFGKPTTRMNRSTADVTVTIAYVHPKSGQEISLTLDTQDCAEDNLRALYLGIEEMRMIAARGLDDVVRQAYAQIEAPKSRRDPFEILGVRPDAPRAVIEASYRALALVRHPDRGGDNEAMKELNDAYERVTA